METALSKLSELIDKDGSLVFKSEVSCETSADNS